MGLMYKFKVSLYDPVINEVTDVLRYADSEEKIWNAYDGMDVVILAVEELPTE